MNWIKFCLFMSPVGLLLFALSQVHIDIFTYKDSNKLERVVLSAKVEHMDYGPYCWGCLWWDCFAWQDFAIS